MAPLISISDLNVSYGDSPVLRQVETEIHDGEVIAIIGPSGCGKSTLLKVIAGVVPGMIEADVEGEISIAGNEPASTPRGIIDVISQEDNLLGWRSVQDNVSLGLELLDREIDEQRILRFLSLVGLEGFSGYFPLQLSGGMKKRVSLAACLITGPQILLMDEPFGSLDALTREEMWRVVEDLRQGTQTDAAIVMVTHSVEEAAVLADRVLVMSCIPATIREVVEVDIERPRMIDGEIKQECLTISNRLRSLIRKAGQNER